MRPIEGKANKNWYIAFYISLAAMLWGFGCIFYTVGTGIGGWGLNKNIGWAWDITNFVWWVGIGHAGTLISAVLLLFRQKWRMAINRSAEAMTIFAVFQAGLFPIIHFGRQWNGYFVLPSHNQFGPLWVNFNSPYCGMCLQYLPIYRYRSYSGGQGCFPTLLPFEIEL